MDAMNWPGFSVPANAWWLLLLLPVILLYFLRLKRPRREISSLALWQSVLNDQRVNAPFQRFRKNTSLWLQVLLLTLLVLAAMQPFLPARAEQADYLPVLIDCSASMAARDAQGQSRLDLAKARVRDLIEHLLPGQRLSLIAFHATARRLTEFTDNRRVLLDALEQLEVQDVPGRLEDALRMTQALARTVPLPSVVLYSDGNFPQRVSFELPFQVNYQQLPAAGPNVGITEFNARQRTPPEWDVFLRLEANADTAGTVSLMRDGQVVGSESFVIDAGDSRRLTFRIRSEIASSLEARLTLASGRTDSLDTDNVAYLDLPTARPLRVFVAPTLPSFRRALRDMPGLDLHPRDDDPAAASIAFDLAISDQPADRDIDATVQVFTGLIPDDLASLVQTSGGLTEFIDWDRSAPLLQHMQLRDVQLSDSIRRQAGVTDGDFEQRGYSILATGRDGPLILAQRLGPRSRFHLLFHTDRSTLPYRVAFPILAANAVQVSLHEAAIAEVRAARTRVLPPLKLNPDTTYRITSPGPGFSSDTVFTRTSRSGGTARSTTARTTPDGVLTGIPAPHAGRYQIVPDTVLPGIATFAAPTIISASLLDSRETLLSTVDRILLDDLTVQASTATVPTSRPLWPAITLLALFTLLVEWHHGHRPPGVRPSRD